MEFEQLARTAVGHVDAESAAGSATSIPELLVELAGARSSAPTDRAVRAMRALRFHVGLARVIAGQLAIAADVAGTDVVGVTGGCALNRLLMAALRDDLAARGLSLLEHRVIPANDGGLGVGQAMAGVLAARDRRAARPGAGN